MKFSAANFTDNTSNRFHRIKLAELLHRSGRTSAQWPPQILMPVIAYHISIFRPFSRRFTICLHFPKISTFEVIHSATDGFRWAANCAVFSRDVRSSIGTWQKQLNKRFDLSKIVRSICETTELHQLASNARAPKFKSSFNVKARLQKLLAFKFWM